MNVQKELKVAEKMLVIKRYARSTRKTYLSCLKRFFTSFADTRASRITYDQISDYLYQLNNEENPASSTLNQHINAIKFYFEKVKGTNRMTFYNLRPRKTHYIPTILSVQEIENMVNLTNNLKHKALLLTLYGCGLRISELVNLKLVDFNWHENKVHIKGSKGNKDRIVPVGIQLRNLLARYYRAYKPTQYLFEGEKGGRYAKTSIRKVFNQALKRADIKQPASPHTFRHSFATHLLEAGENLKTIKELLGHNSIKTTERYTHITSAFLLKLETPCTRLRLVS